MQMAQGCGTLSAHLLDVGKLVRHEAFVSHV